MTELLPCPFCGGDAAIYMEPDTIESGEINAMCISGEACHARLYRSIYNPQQPRKNAYDWQFKQWNTRPIEAALRSQIERLKEQNEILANDFKVEEEEHTKTLDVLVRCKKERDDHNDYLIGLMNTLVNTHTPDVEYAIKQ